MPLDADGLRQAVANLYPSLRSLSAEQWATACQGTNRMRLRAGAEVFAEGQDCLGFPLVVEGTIKVVKNTSAGREMVLYRVEPGGSCIITSGCLLGGSAYSARGVAETPVSLVLLPTTLFARLVAEDGNFRAFVFHLFAERIAELMQLVEEVAFHRLDQRLARLLLARGPKVRATHQALADELGSVREIISRLLKGFAGQRLVTLGREQVQVIDQRGLKEIARMPD